jgi:hypothetical protein
MSSLATPEIHEHRVPDQAVVVFIKICENCERNFQRCAGSSRTLCCFCYAQLHTPENQVWRCTECGTGRAWGSGPPAETADKRLACIRCCGTMEHRFVMVVR